MIQQSRPLFRSFTTYLHTEYNHLHKKRIRQKTELKGIPFVNLTKVKIDIL